MMNSIKKLEDKDIIKNILTELRYSGLAFSKELGYSSHSTIHHILTGKNCISDDMANKIIKRFPNVNWLYIKKGEEPLLLPDKMAMSQANFKKINREEEITYDLESFGVLKSIDFSLKRIVELLETKKKDQY